MNCTPVSSQVMRSNPWEILLLECCLCKCFPTCITHKLKFEKFEHLNLCSWKFGHGQKNKLYCCFVDCMTRSGYLARDQNFLSPCSARKRPVYFLRFQHFLHCIKSNWTMYQSCRNYLHKEELWKPLLTLTIKRNWLVSYQTQDPLWI